MTETLRPTLGRRDLTLMVVGNVVGSGIFLVPAAVLRQSGESVPVSALVWCVGGLLSLMGALSYAELGGMNPKAGGLYAYIREAFGAFPAFLYGWTLFFVIGSGTVATLAVAAAGQLTRFAPLTGPQRQLIAVGLIAVMAAINVKGTRESATVQNAATWIKIAAIVLMGTLLLAFGSWGGPGAEAAAAATATATAAATATPVTASGVGLAVIAVLWAYEGWQYVTFLAGDAKDPQRTIPFAIVAGTVALIALYLFSVSGYHAALGTARMAASERVAGDAVTAVLGPAAGTAVTLAIVVAMYSAAHAAVTSVPRVYFAMARDGVFFRQLADIHPRFGTPAVAIVSSSVWAAVLAATGTFEQLLTYVVFVGWIFYGLGAAAVIALRRSRPDAERPFRVPGYPVTPALFVLAACVIVGNTILEQPGQSLVGLGVVFLGVPAYLVWTRRRRRRAAH